MYPKVWKQFSRTFKDQNRCLPGHRLTFAATVISLSKQYILSLGRFIHTHQKLLRKRDSDPNNLKNNVRGHSRTKIDSFHWLISAASHCNSNKQAINVASLTTYTRTSEIIAKTALRSPTFWERNVRGHSRTKIDYFQGTGSSLPLPLQFYYIGKQWMVYLGRLIHAHQKLLRKRQSGPQNLKKNIFQGRSTKIDYFQGTGSSAASHWNSTKQAIHVVSRMTYTRT